MREQGNEMKTSTLWVLILLFSITGIVAGIILIMDCFHSNAMDSRHNLLFIFAFSSLMTARHFCTKVIRQESTGT